MTDSGLSPYITVADADAAIAWYREVFGARELVRYVDGDGRIGHCQLLLGDSLLMLSDEFPGAGAVSPPTLGGTPVKLHLDVADVDATWERALARGAEAQQPPDDQPHGHRGAAFADPFGHQWMVQTRIAEPTDREIEAAMGGMFTIVTGGET